MENRSSDSNLSNFKMLEDLDAGRSSGCQSKSVASCDSFESKSSNAAFAKRKIKIAQNFFGEETKREEQDSLSVKKKLTSQLLSHLDDRVFEPEKIVQQVATVRNSLV